MPCALQPESHSTLAPIQITQAVSFCGQIKFLSSRTTLGTTDTTRVYPQICQVGVGCTNKRVARHTLNVEHSLTTTVSILYSPQRKASTLTATSLEIVHVPIAEGAQPRK